FAMSPFPFQQNPEQTRPEGTVGTTNLLCVQSGGGSRHAAQPECPTRSCRPASAQRVSALRSEAVADWGTRDPPPPPLLLRHPRLQEKWTPHLALRHRCRPRLLPLLRLPHRLLHHRRRHPPHSRPTRQTPGP